MPPMKIQPIDIIDTQASREAVIRTDSAKPVLKSRLKRLFDRPFAKSSSIEKSSSSEAQCNREGGITGGFVPEFDPSTFCLSKMVQNFMEEASEKQSSAKCGRNRCNCFNGNINERSDDEFDLFGFFSDSGSGSAGDGTEFLKSLIPCTTVAERNLLADTAMILEKNKNIKRKADLRTALIGCLTSLGYEASICKSKWDKTPSFPAGEYEYVDVMVNEERLILDFDFRSEFEIARSTNAYKLILQSLPYIFVGKPDRVRQIISIVAEAAKQSLKKKGLHLPPWRKAEYMYAKWLSPHKKTSLNAAAARKPLPETKHTRGGQTKFIIGEKKESEPELFLLSLNKDDELKTTVADDMAVPVAVNPWQPPPPIKLKSPQRGTKKAVTGLASLFKEKP